MTTCRTPAATCAGESFPPEVACASADGTLTGANAEGIEVLFFASLVLFVLLTSMVLALAAVRGK